MKRLVILIFIVGYCSLAQESATISMRDFNFESATNPAFTLLETSPTQMNTPTNLREVAVYLNSGISNTNLAMEINPYWFIDSNKRDSYLGYRGFEWKRRLNANGEMTQTYVHNAFTAYETQSSITLGYIAKKFEGFDEERPVAAVGFRTTLISYYNATRQQQLKRVVQNIRNGVASSQNIAFKQHLDLNHPDLVQPDDRFCDRPLSDPLVSPYLEAARAFISQQQLNTTPEDVMRTYLAERCEIVTAFVTNPKTIRPNFRLDGALAYSWLFAENSVDSATENRFASWLTADLAVQFSDTSYLHAYAIGKYLEDGFRVDTEGRFFTETFWDVGGKLSLDTHRFQLGLEYLKRFGSGTQERFVGSITYQLNENISFVGAFGEDFPQDDNLLTLFGINWGIANGNQVFTQK